MTKWIPFAVATILFTLSFHFIDVSYADDDPMMDPNMHMTDGSSLPKEIEKEYKSLKPDEGNTRKPASNKSGLDPLFTDGATQVKKTKHAFPEDLAKSFTVVEPSDDENRKPATKKSKNRLKQTDLASVERRSNLPKSIANGFELRVRANKLVSTFWVVNRGDRYDLLFRNNAGSTVSLGLSRESFQTLHSSVRTIKPESANLKKCADSSMQMHIVAGGTPERTITTCINGKSRSAADLRNASNYLAALVR